MQPKYIPYITLNDYLVQIRSGQLNNELLDYITQGGDIERKNAEAYALDEIRSILGSYFYLDFEFRPLERFWYNKKYHAGDRIVIDFPMWVGSNPENVDNEIGPNDTLGGNPPKSYDIGDCVIYNGGGGYVDGVFNGVCPENYEWFGYCCKQPTNSSKFNLGEDWLQIGKQYDIYFVNFPYLIFKLVPDEAKGTKIDGLYRAFKDHVCWANRIWKCINSSVILDHHQREQYGTIGNIPPPNIFPDSRNGDLEGNYYGSENFFDGSGNPEFELNPNFPFGNKQWCDEGEFYFQNILPFYPNWDKKTTGIYCDEYGYCYDGKGCPVSPNSDGYIKNWVLGDNRSQTMIEIVVAIAIHKLLGRNSFMLKERAIAKDWAYAKLEKIKLGKNTTLIPIIQPEQPGGGFTWGGDVKKVNQWR